MPLNSNTECTCSRGKCQEERKQFWKNTSITFFTIFFTNAFAISASFYLFFHMIADSKYRLPGAAILTFGNFIFLTILFMTVHLTRNHFTVTRPVKKIQKGLEEITNGDFSVRIAREGTCPPFGTIIDSINHMAEELSSVETLKTDFISNVSHEIKTPIAVMQNYSRLLQSESLTDAERQEYAGIISDASFRLSDLVSNILKLNRLENQQIKASNEQFDLGGQLAECLLGFESVWEEKHKHFDSIS